MGVARVIDLRGGGYGCRSSPIVLLVDHISRIKTSGERGQEYEFILDSDMAPRSLVVEYIERSGLEVLEVREEDKTLRIRVKY